MGFVSSFWRDAQAWDRPVKIGVGMALVLLVVVLVLTLSAPQEARPLMIGGLIALVFVLQGLILWGNRHLVTAYTQAQQQFLAEDYTGARDTLLASLTELDQKGKRPSVETLTLLGNTYRNLGLLAESEDILTTALKRQPQNPFPLYGFGRTLLAAGRFADAETYFRQALEMGGTAGMLFDVALAQGFQDLSEEAFTTLRRITEDTTQDVTRRWMAQQILPLGRRVRIDLSVEDVAFAKQFWRKEAERFAATPYGQKIRQFLEL